MSDSRIEALRQMIEKDPNDTLARFMLAMSSTRRGITRRRCRS